MVHIRALTPDDAEALDAVRLRALTEHPEAFGATPEEESGGAARRAEHLKDGPPDSMIFGAFLDGALVGICLVYRHLRIKTRHRASIGGMYVAPEARGRGAGRMLVDAALDHARSLGGVQDVVLAVTSGNDAARHLYEQAGFVRWGVDPRYIRVGDVYHDIEWMVLHIAEA